MKILFFAQLSEQIGHEIQFDCTICTVAQIVTDLQQRYPHASLQTAMVAVNEQFATMDTVVQVNDIVAFLPPVSGG